MLFWAQTFQSWLLREFLQDLKSVNRETPWKKRIAGSIEDLRWNSKKNLHHPPSLFNHLLFNILNLWIASSSSFIRVLLWSSRIEPAWLAMRNYVQFDTLLFHFRQPKWEHFWGLSHPPTSSDILKNPLTSGFSFLGAKSINRQVLSHRNATACIYLVYKVTGWFNRFLLHKVGQQVVCSSESPPQSDIPASLMPYSSWCALRHSF